MIDRAPLVSVVMPVFNAERFLREAIISILGQSFTDLELILVNDGSTDGSAGIIASFSDPRILVITQANQGISAALNHGIAAARGEFIARMDADDVSHPERIAKQAAYLRSHPDIGLLGTWATVEDEHGKRTGVLEHPTDDARIRHALLFDTPFVHPSMMVRRSLFQQTGGYDGDPAIFEDHDLWSRMIHRTRAANLPEHLLRYRLVGTSLSHITAKRSERVLEQRKRNMRAAFPGIDEGLLSAAAELGLRHAAISFKHFKQVHALLHRHIARSLHDPVAAREARDRMNHAMVGYRLIPHRTLLHRIIDRVVKELLVRALRAPAPSP